jgi:uroporphyrinogen decarboxylase
MTYKERVIKAINFEKTDKVPHNVDFTLQALERTAAKYGWDYINGINNHLAGVDLNKPQIEVKPGYFRDEYGIVWDKTGADKDIGMPSEYLIKSPEDFAGYIFPEVDVAYITEQCEKIKTMDKSKFIFANYGFCMYERVWTLMGIEDTLCAMITDPEFIHGFLGKICERNLKILDIALKYDFDGILFGDDWGQQHGMIMGAERWREFIKPYIGKMYAKVKESGKYVLQHSCGDISEIMDDLYEIGLNVYQTFQPEIYGFDYAEKMRGKIAIWGGISTQHELPFKTPEEIGELTRSIIARFRENGGIIVAPTHSVPGDVPPENIKAMINAFLEQCSISA